MLVKVYWRFGGTYCLHLQDRSQISSQQEEKNKHIFDLADAGKTFLRNVGKF
jgi:predicted transcriptional regulator